MTIGLTRRTGGQATVMVVDDSAFFRKRLTRMIERDGRVKVVAQAENGAQAVTLAGTRKPSAIIMDVNMPVMDGITAVREIMARHPIPILMFSALTHEGAKESLDAMEAGAVDFMPKSLGDFEGAEAKLGKELCDKLIAVSEHRGARSLEGQRPRPAGLTASPAANMAARPAAVAPARPGVAHGSQVNVAVPARTRLVVIGSSTGGPVALQEVIKHLRAPYPMPIVIAQHMPDRFTGEFAKRLDHGSTLDISEPADGTLLKPNSIYICRGGMQTEVVPGGDYGKFAVRPATSGEIYSPCVDVLFDSAARLTGGDTLAVILTGMGADGTRGAQKLKSLGATVWAQDAETCVVYGMPQAVARAGVVDQVLPLPEVGPALARCRSRH